jgi:hypothetical protein
METRHHEVDKTPEQTIQSHLSLLKQDVLDQEPDIIVFTQEKLTELKQKIIDTQKPIKTTYKGQEVWYTIDTSSNYIARTENKQISINLFNFEKTYKNPMQRLEKNITLDQYMQLILANEKSHLLYHSEARSWAEELKKEKEL